MPPKRSTRSRSRGRVQETAKSPPTPKAKTPSKKKAAAPVENEMQFAEGAKVMARWPGSSLFFKATVQYVREDDNEYDVEYENGTVYTIKAKDVYSQGSSMMKSSTRARSRSRGRSPARSKAAAKTADAVDGKAEKKEEEVVEKPAKAAPEKAKVLKAETPTRVSKRIAAKAVMDAYSDDESEKVKLAPNPELPDARGKKRGWNLEWVYALLFMVLAPAILISLHTLCNAGCKLDWPKFSKDPATYFDLQALGMVMAFGTLVDALSFLPVGTVVNGRRMNGFISLTLMVCAVFVLVYFKVPLGIVNQKYFTLMTSCVLLSFITAIISYAIAKWKGKNNLNPKGTTGNPVVDFFNGVEMNPKHLNLDWKLQCLRFSMMTLAMLNVVLVADNLIATRGRGSPQGALAAAFQIIYAIDALFFEEYFFLSADAMNSGFGWSLISSYMCYPFLPTLTTRFLLGVTTPMNWYYMVGTVLLNGLGFVIYRSSENLRCEFVKNPSNPELADLETLTHGNKKLVVSSWWGLVRHPNYLGEILITWSWVLPAACSLGTQLLVPYYLPVITTVLILVKSHQINLKNKRKFGSAWTTYTEKVRSNIIPYVY